MVTVTLPATSTLFTFFPTQQASREPLPPEAMSEIFEDIKDMGVLIGKGGVYGQVTALVFK